MSKPGQIIPTDAYPQLVPKSEVAAIARLLKSPETAERGNRAVSLAAQGLRAAVHALIAEMEQAGPDLDRVWNRAHEIRGFAQTAGLESTGHIANGLCRYFDDSEQLGLGPDPAIVALHVAAIARAEKESGQTSQMVARELAALVRHKLTEIKNLTAIGV